MNNFIEMTGLAGALLGGYAYLPQITHLIAEKCSAGISIKAYRLWLLSSALILINAVYHRSIVFIVLASIQLLSSLVILVFSMKHKNSVCKFHAHGNNPLG